MCATYKIMPKVLEKVERRLGEKLFLKGDRCAGPKCAAVRRGYAPGAHGKSRRRGGSEFGSLLKEKQKVRFLYGLDDLNLRRYTQKAAAKGVAFSTAFYQMLERRLDNVVFLVGFAVSRRMARQMVNHGHVTVNGKSARTPSYEVKTGDSIGIKERMLARAIFADLDVRLKKIEPPSWLSLEKGKREAKVLQSPDVAELQAKFDSGRVKEFYSR